MGGNLSSVTRLGDKDLQETRLNGLCLCRAEKISPAMKGGRAKSNRWDLTSSRTKGALITSSEQVSVFTRAAV